LAARHEIPTHRPRLLLVGEKGQGHSSHLAPAILHHFESLPVYVLDLPALYAVGMKSPEEACSQVQTAVYESRHHLCRLPYCRATSNIHFFRAMQCLRGICCGLVFVSLHHKQVFYQNS